MSAQEESDAIERALASLALTDDDRLEGVLSKLLPRAIASLATTHASSVPKIMNLLKHINKRVNAMPGLRLPLEAIVEAYVTASNALVRNFALVYVEKAFERADGETREIQISRALRGASKRSAEHVDILCRLAFDALGTLARGDPRRDVGFLVDDDDRRVFLRRARDFFCYAPNATGTSATTVPNRLETHLNALANASIGVEGAPGDALRAAAATHREEAGREAAAPALSAPPSLSPSAVERVLGKGKEKPTPASLAMKKRRLLEFISSAEIVEKADVDMESEEGEDGSTERCETRRFLVSGSEMLTHCIVASCDSDHEVAKRGEELLKRRCTWETNRPIVNLDDPKIADELFRLFLGSSTDVPVASRILPASPAVKLKIMNLLTRSMAAADAFPKNIETVKMCLYDVTSTTRLKAYGMQFTVWMLSHATNEELFAFAPSLMSGMLEILDSRADGSSEGDQSVTFAQETLRGFCYQALSQLAERDKSSVNKDVLLAERIFEALEKEPDGVKSYVQEAARTLISAYRESPSTYVQTRLEELVVAALEDTEHKAKRLVGAQWANDMFPFSHVPSRYACILGSGDAKHEMQTLGRNGLRRRNSSRASSAPPRLRIEPWDGCDREVTAKSWANENDMFDDLSGDHYRYMEYVAFCRGETPAVLERYPPASAVLRYLLERLPELGVNPALHATLILPENAMSAALAFVNECVRADRVASRALTDDAETLYRNLLHRCLVKSAGPTLASAALLSLIDAIERTPSILDSKETLNAIQIRLRHFIAHTDDETRERAAKLCGVLAARLEEDARAAFLNETLDVLADDARGVRLEHREGALCASGYMVGSGCASEEDAARAIRIFVDVARRVGKGQSADATAASVAAEAIGHAAARAPLRADVIDDALAALGDVLRNTDPNVARRAARASGYVLLADTRESTASALLPRLLELCDVKNDDTQFAIGEALAFAWGGVDVDADRVLTTSFTSLSAAAKSTDDERSSQDAAPATPDANANVDVYDPSADPRAHIHCTVLDAIFNRCIYSSRVEKRCAACVWLLSLVTHCGRHPRVSMMLQDVQEAFGSLLGDQNELTQELASRGMSVLYEMGDEAQRKELLAALMGTLNGAAPKKRHVKLDDDAEVFEEGTIAIDDKALRSGDGDKNSLTTYQELCSVVTDIGQPDLIYKFMDLANHQRALNSSRGAAFGFASIAKKAGDAVTPHLEKLVPKLYRMMHDPNPKMQEAVKGIWISLVDSPKATVDAQFDAIMEELLNESGSRLWRSRQSSASSLSDILSGRTFREVKPYLSRLWDVCLRVIDDIKETVRLAGEGMCRSLRSLTLRLCDAHHSGPSEVKETIEIVLPILLQKGLISPVKEVQALSMDVIMKLVKFADGDAIKPHITDIVKTLLESLSGMEDSRLNYIEQHAASFGQAASEKLEAMRLRAAKSTPMGETLDLLMTHIDETVMSDLVSTMSSVLRTGVGLNTRAGAGRFLQRFCMRRGRLVRPHAANLFNMLLTSAVNDASAAIRASYVAAIAAISKYAEEPQVHALVQEIVRLSKSETDGERGIAAQLSLELSRSAPDALSPQKTFVLPLAFVGAHDSEDAGQAKWREVWDENSGGVSASLRLYFDEILKNTSDLFKSSQWHRKRQAAKVFTDMALKSPDVIAPKAQEVMVTLVSELPGRIWEGKICLLEAVSALTTGCPQKIDVQSTLDALLAESKRTKSDYRKAALHALDSSIIAIASIEGCDYVNLMSKVVPVVDEALKTTPTRVDDIDSGVGAAGSLQRMEEAKYEAEKRIRSSGQAATAAASVLSTVLNRVKSLDAIRPHASKCAELCASSLDAQLSSERRREGLKGIVGLMRLLSETKDTTDVPFDVEGLFRLVVEAVDDTSSTSLRLDAVAALAALAAHAPTKQAVESILKKMITDKNPEVVRSAMRAKAEISGDSVPMTA